jgi:hypothetical protein
MIAAIVALIKYVKVTLNALDKAIGTVAKRI